MQINIVAVYMKQEDETFSFRTSTTLSSIKKTYFLKLMLVLLQKSYSVTDCLHSTIHLSRN